jgi:glutaredoxin 3
LCALHPTLTTTIQNKTATIASALFNPVKGLIRTFFSTPSVSPAAMSAAKTKAQKIIDENAVVVFSKSYCPYCKATKSLLAEKNAKFFLMELDQVGKSPFPHSRLAVLSANADFWCVCAEDGPALQDALEEITGQRSVPNIFIDHKHIGGNSDLQSKKGQLSGMLKEAGAV